MAPKVSLLTCVSLYTALASLNHCAVRCGSGRMTICSRQYSGSGLSMSWNVASALRPPWMKPYFHSPASMATTLPVRHAGFKGLGILWTSLRGHRIFRGSLGVIHGTALHAVLRLSQQLVHVRCNFRVEDAFFPGFGRDFGIGNGDVFLRCVQALACERREIVREGLQFLLAQAFRVALDVDMGYERLLWSGDVASDRCIVGKAVLIDNP